MRIRAARLSDAGSIRALETKVWGEEVTSIWDIGTFIRCGHVYVACIGRRIVGAVVVIQHRHGGFYVVDLVVAASIRRKGIGRRLYRRILRLRMMCGGGVVETHVGITSVASIQLHRELGFTSVRMDSNAYGLQKRDEKRILMRYTC